MNSLKMNRRSFLATSATAALPIAFPMLARAQEKYPTSGKNIQLIVSVPPGGDADLMARTFGRRVGKDLKTSVIVVNKPGASGKIASDFVKRSDPDGYTILSTGSSSVTSLAAARVTGTAAPVNLINDFAPVGTIALNTYAAVVAADMPVHNVKELIAYLKAHPGAVNYGSTGVGKLEHACTEMFCQGTGTEMLHVPFKGLSDVLNQMMAGNVQVCFSALHPMMPHIRAGKLRLLAVTGSKRSPLYPDIPTVAEAANLPDYAVDVWLGVAAPQSTPPEAVKALNLECEAMAKDQAFIKNFLTPNAMQPFYTSPEDMTALVKKDVDKFTQLFKASHLTFS